jgi:enolase
MLNIINGGAHANKSLQIQEFMIRNDGAKYFKDCIHLIVVFIM